MRLLVASIFSFIGEAMVIVQSYASGGQSCTVCCTVGTLIHSEILVFRVQTSLPAFTSPALYRRSFQVRAIFKRGA